MKPDRANKPTVSSRQVAEQRLLNALIVYLLGFFLNEVLTIDLGPFFFRPEKIALFLGCAFLYPYVSLPFRYSRKATALLSVWVYYNIWMGLSVFWNPDYGTFLNQVNILIKHGGEAFLTCGIVGAAIRAGGVATIRKLLPLFMLFASMEILTGALDYFAGHRVVPSGTRDADYTYGIGIFGFHAERLFFAELMVIGSAISLATLNRKGGGLILKWMVLLLAPLFLLLLTSYTGILTYLLLLSVYFLRLGNGKGRLYVAVVIVLGIALLPTVYMTMTPDWFKDFTAKKLESRMEGGDTTEWRFLTSVYLIDQVIESPTLFGEGYLSSKDEIGRFFDKAVTSHTLVSVPYEQGLVGLLLFSLLFYKILANLSYMLRAKSTTRSTAPDIVVVTTALGLCTVTRFLFYFQVSNVYLYVLTVGFLTSIRACECGPQKAKIANVSVGK